MEVVGRGSAWAGPQTGGVWVAPTWGKGGVGGGWDEAERAMDQRRNKVLVRK